MKIRILFVISLLVGLVVLLFWQQHGGNRQAVKGREEAEMAPAAEVGPTGLRIVSADRPGHSENLVPRDNGGHHLRVPAAGSLRSMLNPTSPLSYEERLAGLREITGPLRADELEALLRVLREGMPVADWPESRQRAFENALMNLLHRQDAHYDLIRAVLVEIVHAEEQPAVKRDYALQHLASIEQMMRERRVRSGQFDAVPTHRATHWEVVEQGPTALAATAMLHLLDAERSAGGWGEGERERLAEIALALARDEQTDPESLATVLQVCARLGVGEVSDRALAIAVSDTSPFPLRIAAVATLGDLPATEEVRAVLETMATGREQRLRLPATSALHRLTQEKEQP